MKFECLEIITHSPCTYVKTRGSINDSVLTAKAHIYIYMYVCKYEGEKVYIINRLEGLLLFIL